MVSAGSSTNSDVQEGRLILECDRLSHNSYYSVSLAQ